VPVDNVGHPVTGADRHGALVHDDEGVIHHLGDGLSRHAHVAQVSLTVDALGGAHGDKDDLGVGQALLIAAGEGEAPRTHVTLHHLLKAWLIDGHVAGQEGRDLSLVDVEAYDAVAKVSKAGAGHESNIAGADDGDLSHGIPFIACG